MGKMRKNITILLLLLQYYCCLLYLHRDSLGMKTRQALVTSYCHTVVTLKEKALLMKTGPEMKALDKPYILTLKVPNKICS